MLTGDNAVVARAVGRRLGLTHQFADMLPADKANRDPGFATQRPCGRDGG